MRVVHRVEGPHYAIGMVVTRPHHEGDDAPVLNDIFGTELEVSKWAFEKAVIFMGWEYLYFRRLCIT